MTKRRVRRIYSSENPDPLDVHVGQRLRERRIAVGMTMTDLGHKLGLTFQQIQKFERGINRIGAGRLYRLAQILDVPVEHFFDGAKGVLEHGRVDSRQAPRRLELELGRDIARLPRSERALVRKLVKALVTRGNVPADEIQRSAAE